ncbi:MAG TPA: carboxymuconolactone decarboxylase family protein [Polyangiales bacterium]|jgi:AhpD family alkylhydroperoxidase|nr:carboxymuconolactone decarboxylase family protein [Polyangiales bacterium]
MFGFVPDFLAKVPDEALPGAWEEMKTLQMNPKTALPPKIKEMIGLAVAAQIPCHYCTYAHTEFAKLFGATDTERGEAVMEAALTRHWSTWLQGKQTDMASWRAEITGMLEYSKQMMSGKVAPPAPMNVTDSATAMQDMKNGFGKVPSFIKGFPDASLSGAWKELRDVEMSETTQLSGKHKSLIGLAVASQIPCRFCIMADIELAKMQGASEAEINEAIANGFGERGIGASRTGQVIGRGAQGSDGDEGHARTRDALRSSAAPP